MILKDKSLVDSSYWYADKQTVKTALDITASRVEFDKAQGDGEFNTINDCKHELPGVYSFKMFDPEWCKRLINEIETCGIDMEPNPNEDELRQIPELVFSEHSYELLHLMRIVVRDIINPYSFSLYGQSDLSISTVQVAKYNPKGKKAGAWHHDSSADFTVVVPLNTGDYVGGGTEFYNLGIVEPLPTGSALMFPATSHMHRGLAVEEGDRYLLVFWLFVKDRIPDLVANLV